MSTWDHRQALFCSAPAKQTRKANENFQGERETNGERFIAHIYFTPFDFR